MNTNSEKIGLISCTLPFPACSVVGENLPFVGPTSPGFSTRIGQNQPSVVTGRESGFTLIELIVILVVASILVSLAVPNMRTLIQDGRLSSQANDLLTDISVARSHAVHRPATVGICPSANGTACLLPGSGWENGRLMFVDGDSDNTCCSAADERVRYREAPSTENTQRTANIDPLIFNAEGLMTSGGGAFTFNLCDKRGTAHGRVVTVNRTQARVTPKTTLPASCP